MTMLQVNNHSECFKQLVEANRNAEYVEVLLRNIVALQDTELERFTIPFDDVIVSLELAISILEKDF